MIDILTSKQMHTNKYVSILITSTDVDVVAFTEPQNKELPKGVAATFSYSITVSNLADSAIAAAGSEH